MERTVIGENVWLYIRTAPNVIIPIKCLTQHTISASQEISNTITKCGRKKTPQGDPDYQISGEGQIMYFTGADTAANYSSQSLFTAMASKQRLEVVSAPADAEEPVEGDVTYTGFGYLSEWEAVYDAGAESTFSFTVDIDGDLIQEVQGPS